MELTNTQKALESFSKYVIQQSRTRLTKTKQNYTSELYNSLKYDFVKSDDGFIVDFMMQGYGEFQDRGVKGTQSTYSQSSNSPFSYKPSSNLRGLEYNTGIFSKWAKFRGLQPRDKKGRFGSYKTMGYILADSIKKKGIKATMFFTKSFEMGFEKLPQELQKAFLVDVEYAIVLAAKK
jgi:hypothetical protein